MGVDTKGDNELYVRDGRSLSLPVPFLPIVQISALGYNVKGRRVCLYLHSYECVHFGTHRLEGGLLHRF